MKRESCPLFFLLLLAVPASARQGRPGPEPPPRDEGCVVQFVPRVTCPGDSASFLGIVDQPPEGKKGLYVRSHGRIVIVQSAPIGDGGLILPDRKAVKKPVRLWCALMDAGVADNVAKKVASLLKKREGQLTEKHRHTREHVMKIEDSIDAARRQFAAQFRRTINLQDQQASAGERRRNEQLIVTARTHARLTTEIELNALDDRMEALEALIELLEAMDDGIVADMEAIDSAIDFLVALGTPNHTARLDVAEVQSVRLQAIDAPLSLNPNMRGGLRILPDPELPGGTERPNVGVVAEVRPRIAGLRIFFKTVDPDDPFTDRAVLDSNGVPGDDNIVFAGDGPKEGVFLESQMPTVQRITDGSGRAEATLRVNFQPGNNFQVLASCHEADVASVDGTTVSQNQSPHRLTSEMVTVWRRLHVEADSMKAITEAPDGNRESGFVTDLKVIKLGNKDVLWVETSVNLKDSAGRFAKGKMVSGGKEFDVIGNTSGLNMVLYLPLGTDAPLIGADFHVYDDDFDGTVDRGLLPRAPNGNLLGTFYRDAYLDVYVDGGGDPGRNGLSLLPVANAEGHQGRRAAIDGTANSPGIQSHVDRSRLFWILYVQSAFQGDKPEDNDPNVETDVQLGFSIVGQTDPPGGSLVFRESIRDVQVYDRHRTSAETLQVEARLVVHETAHQFNLPDDTGGIMGQSLTDVHKDIAFRDAHLTALRSRHESPGMPED